MINVHKRVKGEPTSGKVTVVNTDIEGYTGETSGARTLRFALLWSSCRETKKERCSTLIPPYNP
jgi:hypothetical protein